MQITVTLTEAQVKALGTEVIDIADWVKAWPAAKANALINSIASAEALRRLGTREPMLASKDELVLAAPIETAAERNVRLLNEMQALLYDSDEVSPNPAAQ